MIGWEPLILESLSVLCLVLSVILYAVTLIMFQLNCRCFEFAKKLLILAIEAGIALVFLQMK